MEHEIVRSVAAAQKDAQAADALARQHQPHIKAEVPDGSSPPDCCIFIFESLLLNTINTKTVYSKFIPIPTGCV